jgi:hypothetical protein
MVGFRERHGAVILSQPTGRMVNRMMPGRVYRVADVEEAVIDGNAGGALLAGAAAVGGRRPAGPGAAHSGAASPAASGGT